MVDVEDIFVGICKNVGRYLICKEMIKYFYLKLDFFWVLEDFFNGLRVRVLCELEVMI